MRPGGSLDDYRQALFNAAFEAGGYDNVTIALLECVNVEEGEEDFGGKTLSPEEMTKKKKEKRKGRWLKFIIALVIVFILLAAAALMFDVVTIGEAGKLQFNLKSISL